MTYRAFLEWLTTLLPSTNLFFAIRIDGVFAHVKVRSVPKQESYRPLVEIAKEQPVFNFHDLEGTLAGFFTPSFMSSLNVPGLHLHFLSADLRHGGASHRMYSQKSACGCSVYKYAGTLLADESRLSNLGVPPGCQSSPEQGREVKRLAFSGFRIWQ